MIWTNIGLSVLDYQYWQDPIISVIGQFFGIALSLIIITCSSKCECRMCLFIFIYNAAKINEETGEDLDDNVMFDDVDGEEDDIDDVCNEPIFTELPITTYQHDEKN